MRIVLAAALLAALPAMARAEASGQALFNDNCAACHQRTGMGVKGAFPALAGNKFVQGPPAVVMATVLVGRGGMPAFKSELSDSELAAVLTYVRSSWGNKGAPLAPKDVAAVRARASAIAQPKSLQAH